MEDYFPEVVALLEKHKKAQAPWKRTGNLQKAANGKGEKGGGDFKEACRGERGGLGGRETLHTAVDLQRDSPNQRKECADESEALVDQKEKEEALIDAAREGDFRKVKKILEEDAKVCRLNLDMPDPLRGWTPLIWASCKGHAEIVQLLIAANASVDWQTKDGVTGALFWASHQGYTKIVRLLVDAKANVDLQDRKGETALFRASEKGHTDMVRLLVNAKANVDIQNQDERSALIRAASNGHTEIVRLLVDTNAKVDTQDRYCETALITASYKGHTDIVRLLVDSNANVDTKDKKEDTPLLLASSSDHTGIVRLLLDANAAVDIQNIWGQSALMQASLKGHTDNVRLLMDANANASLQNKKGHTALMTALKEEDVNKVEVLLSSSAAAAAAVDIPDSEARTPLMQAASVGHILLLELLIRRGADLTLKDSTGKTALAVAEEAGNMQWNELRSLIDSGAVAFWPLHFLRSLLKEDVKLPYRQKIGETADALGVVCQPFSIHALADSIRHPLGASFKLVAVSYPWLSKEHPDPDGFRLRSVLEQLDKHWWAQEGSPVTAFVFWDYLSLFQHPPDSRRTAAEDVLFKEGLSKMDLIYSSPHTHVIRSTAVPESASNPTPYIERGWCWFESAVTAFKPPAQVISDEADPDCKGASLTSLRIPATPLDFSKTLNTKKFTNGKSDADGVKTLYKKFLHRSVQKLRVFADGSWASSKEARKEMDPEAAFHLAALVEYVAADPSLASSLQPQVLDLNGSAFDDAAFGRSSESFFSLTASSKPLTSLERLLCAFGNLRSITAVNFKAFNVSRAGPEESKKVYLEGLRKGLTGLFRADGPCPLDINLHLLALAGVSEVFARLICGSKTVNVDMRDEATGGTALLVASGHGHTDIVGLLVEAKANLDLQDNNGLTALIRASSSGHTDAVRLLVDAKAKLDIQDKGGKTALIRASESGQTDIVRLLLDAEADVNIQDNYGVTALLAAVKGHPDIVEMLIDAKADLDLQEKLLGFTALMTTSSRGETNIVRLLVNANADLDKQDYYSGKTALMFAFDNSNSVVNPSFNGYTDIVQLLIDAKANLDMQDKSEQTAAVLASKNGQVDIVRQLITANASLDIKDKDGKTALMWAASKGHTNIVGLLVKAKAKVDIEDKGGETALMKASFNGHPDIACEASW
uniref:Uncharacterized protein n=1 Tax=Chromera velia CCMP2878 TaxID=1169474 RepID=A0A0G4H230_9ALVE|eukprot:Cvel_5576.t1-p1 / transcript=Cvel_5576.t1 / gene=Cvel_5576 / organism=Chromera_velia_CCMP2878 / gene_product=Putative ankyrin repeat protein MM_0045, putative / transcript_product=Putative ankyrin repeat protein MM_0045, putative / location=Cvel_scaffold262:30548-36045(-) / protein_length=1164 / sequence_SO=supercontig / SO=protein_coding / is_pseudo=false